jgi:hypothetical protein
MEVLLLIWFGAALDEERFKYGSIVTKIDHGCRNRVALPSVDCLAVAIMGLRRLALALPSIRPLDSEDE